MVVFPNAKINIGLQILKKRDDGYHNISSILYPIGLSDVLEILPNEQGNIQLTTHGLNIPVDGMPNLCERAFTLFQSQFDISGTDVHLLKNIPTGAGLGGGSSDASFFLKSLNELFQLSISQDKLESMASELGSDCPFFIGNTPAISSGTGTTLKNIQLDLSLYYLVLILPDVHVSTAEAYKGIEPDPERPDLEKLIQTPIDSWQDSIFNDFEISIFPQYPKLKKIKEELLNAGAIYSSMSGSGSGIYGIFKNEIQIPNSLKKYKYWKGSM